MAQRLVDAIKNANQLEARPPPLHVTPLILSLGFLRSENSEQQALIFADLLLEAGANAGETDPQGRPAIQIVHDIANHLESLYAHAVGSKVPILQSKRQQIYTLAGKLHAAIRRT